jgi:hypothetical protein
MMEFCFGLVFLSLRNDSLVMGYNKFNAHSGQIHKFKNKQSDFLSEQLINELICPPPPSFASSSFSKLESIDQMIVPPPVKTKEYPTNNGIK